MGVLSLALVLFWQPLALAQGGQGKGYGQGGGYGRPNPGHGGGYGQPGTGYGPGYGPGYRPGYGPGYRPGYGPGVGRPPSPLYGRPLPPSYSYGRPTWVRPGWYGYRPWRTGWYGGGGPGWTPGWGWWGGSAVLWGITSLTTAAIIGSLMNNAIGSNTPSFVVPNSAYRLLYGTVRPSGGDQVAFVFSDQARSYQATADCRMGRLNGQQPAGPAEAELLNAACQIAFGKF